MTNLEKIKHLINTGQTNNWHLALQLAIGLKLDIVRDLKYMIFGKLKAEQLRIEHNKLWSQYRCIQAGTSQYEAMSKTLIAISKKINHYALQVHKIKNSMFS